MISVFSVCEQWPHKSNKLEISFLHWCFYLHSSSRGHLHLWKVWARAFQLPKENKKGWSLKKTLLQNTCVGSSMTIWNDFYLHIENISMIDQTVVRISDVYNRRPIMIRRSVNINNVYFAHKHIWYSDNMKHFFNHNTPFLQASLHKSK